MHPEPDASAGEAKARSGSVRHLVSARRETSPRPYPARIAPVSPLQKWIGGRPKGLRANGGNHSPARQTDQDAGRASLKQVWCANRNGTASLLGSGKTQLCTLCISALMRGVRLAIVHLAQDADTSREKHETPKGAGWKKRRVQRFCDAGVSRTPEQFKTRQATQRSVYHREPHGEIHGALLVEAGLSQALPTALQRFWPRITDARLFEQF
jgi:hypothetical protein